MSELTRFRPDTPTEMMLWNEIKKLRLKLARVSTWDAYRFTPDPKEMLEVHFPERLVLFPAAELVANLDGNGLRVKLRARAGDGDIHTGYFVDRQPLNKYEAANMLADLHRSELEKLARLITPTTDE